ncbi:MAG: hypothetical protein GVY34_09765 [Alphaproteobacteria bacterium]|jgi:peptidoglycan hydrolase-like protein with peptidoglycan-binding domain|nr:hypothetical protein [Alphaproteobacteria bacterium]
MRNMVLAVLFTLLAAPLKAENIALVIDGGAYRNLPAVSDDGQKLDQALGMLARWGFATVVARDQPLGDLRAELAAIEAQMAEGDIARLVIVASGWFAASQSGVWLLANDADPPSLATVDGAGLRLDTIMEIAASVGEAAHIWLIDTPGRPLADTLGTGLTAGLPDRLAVPRNVAVIRGNTRAVLAGLDAVLTPGTTLSETLASTSGLRADGTVPRLVPFLPAGFAPVAQADRDAWQVAETEDTEDAYRTYLGQYPNGLNAQEARQRIEALRNSPERIEQDLALGRDERRAIQRDLTTLGFNTRGIDGLFGPGTRGAIAGWQAQADFDQTGYLTREQVFELAGQAARRSAEIEAEERERRLAVERADRDYWDSTGAGRDEPGLRAYLDRYPDGIFAALARERLAAIEAEARAQADRDAWARAQSADTLRSYRRYLRQFPDGEFATLARRRVNALSPEPAPPASGAAEAEEARLNLPLPVRLVVERRLDQLGLDPGAVDGNFDEDSRRAISAAQERFDLPVTGYLSQPLLDAMLADVLEGVFR